MADNREGNESEFPKPGRVVHLSSDAECRRRLQERERELKLRLISLREKYSKLVPTSSSNIGKKDDKGDENKSNSLPKENESDAPDIEGDGRGRGRGRTWNPPSSTPESGTAGETKDAASLPKGLGRGRGRGCGRPVEPTPPSPRSPITDENLAAQIAASLQFDDDREFTPPEQRTPGRGKESESSSKNEEIEVGTLPKPGFGRGRGRGKEKPSPPTPSRSSRP